MKYVKGTFIYSALSSPWDCLKGFVLSAQTLIGLCVSEKETILVKKIWHMLCVARWIRTISFMLAKTIPLMLNLWFRCALAGSSERFIRMST